MCNIIAKTSDKTSGALIVIFTKTIFPVPGTLISFIYYLKTIKMVGKIDQLAFSSKKLNAEKLLWYPATIFIVYLPNITYYVLCFGFGFNDSPFWDGATMLITHSLGTFNAIVYGLQRKVYKDIKVAPANLEFQQNTLESINWENVEEI